jgi:hypothetical protein
MVDEDSLISEEDSTISIEVSCISGEDSLIAEKDSLISDKGSVMSEVSDYKNFTIDYQTINLNDVNNDDKYCICKHVLMIRICLSIRKRIHNQYTQVCTHIFLSNI